MLKKDQWKLTFRVQKVIESEVRDLCQIFRDHNDPQHSFMFLLYSFSICQSIRSKRLFNQWRLLSIAFKRKIVWYLFLCSTYHPKTPAWWRLIRSSFIAGISERAEINYEPKWSGSEPQPSDSIQEQLLIFVQ